mmetsp:Transcript_15054/g.18250  ORF Transcript_15054/g.18250 Transcript_15054/m.18250 type:complete len:155 (+) Transcript_15054:118-582(+)
MSLLSVFSLFPAAHPSADPNGQFSVSVVTKVKKVLFCHNQKELTLNLNVEMRSGPKTYSFLSHFGQLSNIGKELKFRKIMAWRSHGFDNLSLINELKNNGIISSDTVYNAMRKVDRGDFVATNCYQDCPVPIGFNATISAPHMHAYALEFLKSK